MARYTEMTEKLGSRLLDASKPAEDAALAAASAVNGITRRLPALPFADRLPTAAEIVEANYALFERLLAAQKEFAVRLVAPATAPTVVLPRQSTKDKATPAAARA